jgi:hypothetical protein
MTVRISTSRAECLTVVHVEGRLAGAGAAELEKTCRRVEGPLRLDLSNLILADSDGIRTIKNLVDHGVDAAGVSPYIALLLERARPPSRGWGPAARTRRTSPRR